MEAFKTQYTLAERRYESDRLRIRFLDRTPVVIYPGPRGVPIDKNKYLVPSHLTFGAFMHIVRKRIKLSPVQSLVGFINGTVLPASSYTIKELYREHADQDGFLYVTYTLENTFG
jgi:GABA(A) receptor-associated protein